MPTKSTSETEAEPDEAPDYRHSEEKQESEETTNDIPVTPRRKDEDREWPFLPRKKRTKRILNPQKKNSRRRRRKTKGKNRNKIYSDTKETFSVIHMNC